MKDLPNIRRTMCSERWAIVPEKLSAMVEVLELRIAKGQKFTAEEIEARRAEGLIETPRIHAAAGKQSGKGGNVAVLPLTGLIMPKSSMVNGESMPSGTSCEAFAQMFAAAVNDPGVSAIVIDVDSPGGSVSGVPELAARMQKARGSKPIVAVANGLAASAAYWLASQADELVVVPSGEVGSIGVFCVHEDASQFYANMGVKHTIMKAGEYKAEGNGFEPLTEEAQAAIQSDIDTFYGMFVAAVAKGRGVGTATVTKNFGQGRCVLAKMAVASGMADRIGTLESVLKSFGVSAQGSSTRAMADDEPLPIAASDDFAGLKARLSEEMKDRILANIIGSIDKTSTISAGMAAEPVLTLHATSSAPQGQENTVAESPLAPPSGAATDATAVLSAERERVKEITALCREHGVDDANLVASMIERGISVNAAASEVLALKKSVKAPVITGLVNRAEKDPRRGFKSHRDFVMSVMKNSRAGHTSQISDERLRPLAVSDDGDQVADGQMAYVLPAAFTPRSLLATVGSDEQGAYSDTYGGFAVPTATIPGMLSIGFDGDPTAGRTQPLPMSAPMVKINARTDKNHSTSVSGGLTVTRTPETAAATSSRMAMEQINMEATALFGMAFASEQILTDSPISFAALIASGFSDQFAAGVLNEKIRGGGGNEMQGVLGAACTVSVAKESSQAANTINSANVINMAARCWGLDQAIWLANHDARPQLYTLNIPIGTAGVPIYQPSRGEGFPDMLLGRPVFYTEYCATVGTVGDIILGNWSQYLEGLYQPLQSAESVHVRFVNHERAFKFWLRNCGAPWWRTALTPAKSSNTLSPFVTVATRA